MAVEDAFGSDVDFAQLIKLYGTLGQTKEDARRYSPAECTGTRKGKCTPGPSVANPLAPIAATRSMLFLVHARPQPPYHRMIQTFNVIICSRAALCRAFFWSYHAIRNPNA